MLLVPFSVGLIKFIYNCQHSNSTLFYIFHIKLPKPPHLLRACATDVFLFTYCSDNYSVPTTGVSQEEILNKWPKKNMKLFPFWSMVPERVECLLLSQWAWQITAHGSTLRHWSNNLLQRIPGLKNAAKQLPFLIH